MIGVFAVLAGAFTILGAALDWDWFMNNSRARLFVGLLGRGGARLFYVGLGMIMIALGFVMR